MRNLDELFNHNKYVSYIEYKNFCKKNNIILNEELLNEKNNLFKFQNIVQKIFLKIITEQKSILKHLKL